MITFQPHDSKDWTHPHCCFHAAIHGHTELGIVNHITILELRKTVKQRLVTATEPEVKDVRQNPFCISCTCVWPSAVLRIKSSYHYNRYCFGYCSGRPARANSAATWRFGTTCETRLAAEAWSSTSASRMNVMGVEATPCKMAT